MKPRNVWPPDGCGTIVLFVIALIIIVGLVIQLDLKSRQYIAPYPYLYQCDTREQCGVFTVNNDTTLILSGHVYHLVKEPGPLQLWALFTFTDYVPDTFSPGCYAIQDITYVTKANPYSFPNCQDPKDPQDR